MFALLHATQFVRKLSWSNNQCDTDTVILSPNSAYDKYKINSGESEMLLFLVHTGIYIYIYIF